MGSVERCLRLLTVLTLTQCVARWWEWLGRVLWTLLTMGAAGLVALVLGLAFVARFVIPPVVSDFDGQVVEPVAIVLVIAGVVSSASGVAFWHSYPSTLRRRGIG